MPRESETTARRSPASLPTGTVTFLFTDIEGSTQRWEQHGDAMRAAVERHDEILRREIEAHRGYVFKTVGDAFCAAFDNAADALAAAIDAQREFARGEFSAVGGIHVRMGLHSGQAQERGSDYFGPEVNRVARLMSIGHGGQVLISGVVQEQVEHRIPADASLVDLGLRRLKDLTQPERVWQLNIAGLPSRFAPLDSLDARPNNLPVQLTALLGRERDLDDLKNLALKNRLVTITGSGGIGKTRVALQLGAELIDRFADGVWFADLSSIGDPELVGSAVGRALGIEQGQGRLDELIPRRLQRKKLLLIIDNCEHLIAAVAALVDSIQRTAADVRIVATSRQPLGIAGEAAHRLPSLAVPDAVATPNAAEAMHYGAIAVFVDRAQHVDTRFSLTEENVAAVTDICRRLDGIPLAIELAAARVNVLPARNLAQRLDERFKLLTGGSRTALPRQKTLLALIDWSYDLLTPEEQQLFASLSVFAGGFDFDAMTSVCGGGGLDEIELLDLLSSLTDKSLVVADTGDAQERFRLLESTRAYASGKLAASGRRDRLARRHAEYFRAHALAADERWGKSSVIRWRTDVEKDLDNYRAALEWSLKQGNDELTGAHIAGMLGRFWRSSGLAAEGRNWISLALARVREDEHPDIALRLWRGYAHLVTADAKVEAAQHALVHAAAVGDARSTAWVQLSLAFGFFQTGRLEEAEATTNRALENFRKLGDKLGQASSLQQLGSIADLRGDTTAARSYIAQTLADFKAVGNEAGYALAIGNLGEIEFKEGNPAEAVRLATEALHLHEQGKDKHNVALYHLNLGVYRVAIGDIEGARGSARQSLVLARDLQSSAFAAIALQHLTLIAALKGQTERAGRLLGFVDAQFQALGMQRETTERWGYDKLMTALSQQTGDAKIAQLAAEGAVWTEDQAVEEGLKID